MTVQLAEKKSVYYPPELSHQSQKEQIKQEVRRRIQEILQICRDLPPSRRLYEVKRRLLGIQYYCESRGKTFTFVQMSITCDEYDLGGSSKDKATLFRGPSEDASVAICITDQGSLLHRNGSLWRLYQNAGDVNPLNRLLSV